MKNLALKVFASFFLMSCFVGGFAFATTGVDVEVSGILADIARSVFDAFRGGHATTGSLLAVVLGVAVLRKYGAKKWPAIATDLGSSVLVLVTTLAATLAAATVDGGASALSWALLWSSVKLAAMAAGGFSLVKRLGGFVLGRFALPGWVKRAFSTVSWLFEKPGEAAIRDAKRAGEAASKASPGEGVGETGSLR